MSDRNRQRGLSIVELMVALAISMLLILGITQLFITSKDSYRVLQGTSRLQEDARFAIASLTRDLRQSGLFGCRSRGDGGTFENILNNGGASYLHNFGGDNAVQGFEQNTLELDGLPLDIKSATNDSDGDPLHSGLFADTDVLALRGALGAGSRLTAVMAVDGTGNVPVLTAGFTKNEHAVITDCQRSIVFQVTDTSGGLAHAAGAAPDANARAGFGFGFDTSAEVYPVSTITYFVAPNDDNVPALFRKEGAREPRELVAGVQSMQFLYGQDTDLDDEEASANRYVPAGSAGLDMSQVVSIRVGLLMRTEENVRRDALDRTYLVLDQAVPTPADGRRFQYQVVTSTITLRNRTFPG